MTHQLTREQVETFLARHKDPADARRFLQEAGLIDENGELAQPYRPERITLSPEGFAALQRRLAEAGGYDPRVAKVLSTPAPCGTGCDKTSTPDEIDQGMAQPLWVSALMAFDSAEGQNRDRLAMASVFRVIADEVERRGDIDYDRDPGETADWLRAEAAIAEQPAARAQCTNPSTAAD